MPLTPDEIKERFDVYDAERQTWEDHWQELSEYLIPRKSTVTVQLSPGQKRNTQVFDSTGPQAAEKLAGALHGMLTNPTIRWFELTTGSEEIDNMDSVRMWLQDTSTDMFNVLNASNFTTEIPETYTDLGIFGTNTLAMEEDQEMVIRFSSRHIKESRIVENNKGFIDQLYREFEWTAEQIVREFGIENVSEKVAKCVEKSPSDKFSIIQAVYPMEIKEMLNVREILRGVFKFHSTYIESESKQMLRSKGYREFPFAVSRWSKGSGETYGRSPGMTALPDVRTINVMQEFMLRGAAKAIDPPVLAPDDGYVLPLKTGPGKVNYYRAGSQDKITSLFQDTRIEFGVQMVNLVEQKIKSAFFVDQLELPTDGPQMTALETATRSEQQLRLMGPMMGRQHSELLRPVITRLYGIMDRRGMIRPIPTELEGRTIDVQYSSVAAKAQRVSEAQNILRAQEAMAGFFQVDPSVGDNISGDEAVQHIARIYGVPQRLIVNRSDVKKVREARAQAQQEAQAAADNAQDAENVKNVAPLVKATG